MRPKLIVNYKRYTLFMSFVAHEIKRLGNEEFKAKYGRNKFKGIKRRYIESMISYINGDTVGISKYKKIIVDPFIYKCYFIYGDKEQFYVALKNAIPQFLVNGILITNVQEAVKGNGNRCISKK